MHEGQILSGKGARKTFFFAVGGAALIFFAVVSVDVLVCQELKSRLKISGQGKFEPAVPFPSFTLRNAQLTWKDRVKLISGDLKVNYNPWQFLGRKNLRVELEGKNLGVEFLGEWASAQGVRKVTLESFYADVGLDRKGLKEVYAVDATSPSFQFRIQRTENRDRDIPSQGEKS